MTHHQRIRIEEVLVHLGLDDDRVLRELRKEGLFETDEIDPQVANEFRVAALMMEELGVNPAGVHVALHLRRRLIALEARATAMMRTLKSEKSEEEQDHVDPKKLG